MNRPAQFTSGTRNGAKSRWYNSVFSDEFSSFESRFRIEMRSSQRYIFNALNPAVRIDTIPRLNLMASKKIVIIGAGPTGLGAAYRLHELGYDNWVMYEKSDDVGGHATSHVDKNGFVWDEGGHVIFSHYQYFDNSDRQGSGQGESTSGFARAGS